MIEFEDLPQFAGGPAVIADPILLLEDGEFRVYALNWKLCGAGIYTKMKSTSIQVVLNVRRVV